MIERPPPDRRRKPLRPRRAQPSRSGRRAVSTPPSPTPSRKRSPDCHGRDAAPRQTVQTIVKAGGRRINSRIRGPAPMLKRKARALREWGLREPPGRERSLFIVDNRLQSLYTERVRSLPQNGSNPTLEEGATAGGVTAAT